MQIIVTISGRFHELGTAHDSAILQILQDSLAANVLGHFVFCIIATFKLVVLHVGTANSEAYPQI